MSEQIDELAYTAIVLIIVMSLLGNDLGPVYEELVANTGWCYRSCIARSLFRTG